MLEPLNDWTLVGECRCDDDDDDDVILTMIEYATRCVSTHERTGCIEQTPH